MVLPYDIATVLANLDAIVIPSTSTPDSCFRAFDNRDCSSIKYKDSTDWDTYFGASYTYEADVRLYFVDCFGKRSLLCEYLNAGVNSTGTYSPYTSTCPSNTSCQVNHLIQNGVEYLVDGNYCFEMTVRALDGAGVLVDTAVLEDCVYIICGQQCVECLKPDVIDRIANGTCKINKYSIVGRDYGSIMTDVKKLNNIMFLLDEYCLTKDECEELRCAVEKIKSYQCK